MVRHSRLEGVEAVAVQEEPEVLRQVVHLRKEPVVLEAHQGELEERVPLEDPMAVFETPCSVVEELPVPAETSVSPEAVHPYPAIHHLLLVAVWHMGP